MSDGDGKRNFLLHIIEEETSKYIWKRIPVLWKSLFVDPAYLRKNIWRHENQEILQKNAAAADDLFVEKDEEPLSAEASRGI